MYLDHSIYSWQANEHTYSYVVVKIILLNNLIFIHYLVETTVIDGWHHIEGAMMGDTQCPHVAMAPPATSGMFGKLYKFFLKYIHYKAYNKIYYYILGQVSMVLLIW